MRRREAVALLEAANPVDPAVFHPPALDLDALPAAPVRRRRRLVPVLATAAVAAVVAVLLVPGAGDEDVIARATAVVAGDAVIFTEVRKVEFGRVVTRELNWTSGDGERRHTLVYRPDGELDSEIVETPAGAAIYVAGARRVDRFPPSVRSIDAIPGDPVTILTRARDGRDGFQVVGEDRIGGERVHLIEAPGALGAIRIAVSAETFLPISATIGLSTYEYVRIEKLPDDPDLFAAKAPAARVRICEQGGPDCRSGRWP